jgi:4'-phosphopantetheinyl transferase
LHVFVARSPKPVAAEIEQEYLLRMPPAVRTSILRYKRWQDRQAALFGKLLLLHFLRSEFPGRWARKFQSFDRSPSGKPFVAGGPQFNISHSGEIVVLAVAPSGEIGIDIEKVRPVEIGDFFHYLPELSWLAGRCDHEAMNLFFDCWTQKEAVLKGCGAGLSLPPAEVVLGRDGAQVLGTRWHLRKLLIDRHYCCHLATDRAVDEVPVRFIDLMAANSIKHM